MRPTDFAVIGAGPAGLAAALEAANAGAKVILLERDDWLGGQLVKQTHQFFGSKNEFAGMRGIDIATHFTEQIEENENIEVFRGATALGYYEDGVLTAANSGRVLKIKPRTLLIASGAMEKMIPFINNDLPGVYGAGAVQTLMNVYGVAPGKKVLMVGAGNIGLIVSYQLMQAGIEVEAIIEGTSKVGGYWVHASKIRRMGVPILTNHTILQATGQEKVEGAIITEIDENWKPLPGAEQEVKVNTICLAVGLSPLAELLWQAGCAMEFSPQLGGYVPIRDGNLETTEEGIYIAGDVAGIEEATSAILEGQLGGISAARKIGLSVPEEKINKIKENLRSLRAGPVGEHIRQGLARVER